MEGTGRVTTDGVGRAGGEGVGRTGGDVLRFGMAGGGRDTAGGDLETVGGDPLRRGGARVLFVVGDLDGGAGTVRDGKAGAGRLGGAGAGGAGAGGLGGGTILLGGGGAAGVDTAPSRLGIEGGFANVRAFAVIHRICWLLKDTINYYSPGPDCPAGFNLGIPPANNAPSWGAPGPAPAIAAAGGAPPPALMALPPPPLAFASMMGALRSLVSAFLSFFPAWICSSSALDAMVENKISVIRRRCAAKSGE